MTHAAWIAKMQRLLRECPPDLKLTGMGSTLFAAGPVATAIIGDRDPVTCANALEKAPDWVALGRLLDSGGF